MNNDIYDVVIIGAGHSGLVLSYHLQRERIKQLVLERGCIGESWRNQRWASFRLNTTNFYNKLPGEFGESYDPHTFTTATAFADNLKAYVERYHLPVVENCQVISVSKDTDTGMFKIVANYNGGQVTYCSRQVVVASGSQNQKKVPDFASRLNTDIVQLHTSEYRSSDKLPAGAVLVVGSAQSGCQVAEDLVDNGRKVYLSTSMVARIPRRYRGKDIVDWLLACGFFDVSTTDVKDPKVFRSTAPQLSGTSGLTISLQSLAAQGVIIIGRVESITGSIVTIEPNASAHVKFADESSTNIKMMINGFIQEKGIEASAVEVDVHDLPDPDATCVTEITSLDLEANDIRTVIWATGFTKDCGYLKPLVIDDTESPAHVNGISDVDGLYFVGLPWLRKRKSGIIHGINEDAQFIATHLLRKIAASA